MIYRGIIPLSDALIAALEKETTPVAKELMKLKAYFTKKSQWIFGGDGWGLFFSACGLFKAPRGLAIAGLAISLLGVILLLAVFGAVATALSTM